MKDVRILEAGFAPGEALDTFAAAHPDAGGLASFVGMVRPTGGVLGLELSHYAPLTLPGMDSLADTAMARFDCMGVLAWHRVGILEPGLPIVLAAAAARHRRAAFAAVDFLMDHLKSDAWFWKRERRADGWRWIEPRAADHADRERWSGSAA